MAVEKRLKNDSYKITPVAFRMMAGKSALAVKGVTALINKKGSFIFPDDLVSDNAFIDLKESGNELLVELTVAISVDVIIPDLSKAVQQAIRNKIEKMAQISVKSVVVNIGSLYAGKQNVKVSKRS